MAIIAINTTCNPFYLDTGAFGGTGDFVFTGGDMDLSVAEPMMIGDTVQTSLTIGNPVAPTQINGSLVGFGAGLLVAGNITYTFAASRVLQTSIAPADTAGGNTSVLGGGGGAASATGGGQGGAGQVLGGQGGTAVGLISSGLGGTAQIQGGQGGSGNINVPGSNGGTANLRGGQGGNNNGSGGGNGGAATVLGGTGAAGNGSSPGALAGAGNLTGGTGGAGTAAASAGNGGAVAVTGGAAGTNNGGGGANGGSVTVRGGAGSGGGASGSVTIGDTNTASIGLGAAGGTTVQLNGRVQWTRATITQTTTTLTIDVNAGSQIDITLQASVTTVVINGLNAGQARLFGITYIQDATGSRTVAGFAASWKFLPSTYRGTNHVAPVLTTTANARDSFLYWWDGTGIIEIQENLNN